MPTDSITVHTVSHFTLFPRFWCLAVPVLTCLPIDKLCTVPAFLNYLPDLFSKALRMRLHVHNKGNQIKINVHDKAYFIQQAYYINRNQRWSKSTRQASAFWEFPWSIWNEWIFISSVWIWFGVGQSELLFFPLCNPPSSVLPADTITAPVAIYRVVLQSEYVIFSCRVDCKWVTTSLKSVRAGWDDRVTVETRILFTFKTMHD